MDVNSNFHTGKRDMGIPGRPSSNSDVPAQVVFMDSKGLSSRTATHPPSSYYQVATPKSPHELMFAEEDSDSRHGGKDGMHRDSSVVGSGDDDDAHHVSGMRKPLGESEEVEKIKYEMAKAEILDKLHLHTLIGNKDVQTIQREVYRIDAQVKLLQTLHDDEKLLDKIEAFHDREAEHRRRKAMHASSSGYYADYSSRSVLPSDTSSNLPLSASSNTPVHHYHTRSKSHGNLSEAPHLRPASPSLMNIRVSGAKSIPPVSDDGQPFRANQMNLHHRRNYSSTCLTSNSGVVGKTEQNEAIFKRYDGILIVITCAHCGRSGFTSAQGIVNHARLKHSKTYSSQPLAVLNNQVLLPTDKQDPEVLQKFNEMEKDPQKEYLPSVLAIPSIGKRESIPKNGLPIQQYQLRQQQRQQENRDQDQDQQTMTDSTRHLREIYTKEDFQELVRMVKTAPQDLENVLKGSVYGSSAEPSESEQEPKSPTPHQASSPLSPARETVKKNNKKRKQDQNEALRDYKERIRPAEKKPRPDVLALSALPEHEKRSSHYNLRAKSKLRAHSDRFD